MKAVGYITVFIALCWGAHWAATNAPKNNVELALFTGALIPIIMAFVAAINED